MRNLVLLSALVLVASLSKAQTEKDIVLLTIKNDRLELAKALKFLKANEPKLTCVNVDLKKCEDVKNFPSNHNSGDTLAVIRASESEMTLGNELTTTSPLLLPAELRRLTRNDFDVIIGCSFLYPRGVTVGYVNLVTKQAELNLDLVEKIQISNTYKNEPTVYHFAVNIALRLNESATRSFIKSHPNILPINFARAKKFKTYSMEQLYSNKESGKALKGKIIILSVDRPEEYRQVSKKKKMTTSEIFANIACQVIE